MCCSNCSKTIDQLIAFLLIVWEHVEAGQSASVTRRFFASVFAGQEAARQRTPNENADAGILYERHQLMLEVASDEGIIQLGGHKPCPFMFPLQLNSFRCQPRGLIRELDVSNLARFHEAVERFRS